MLAPLQASIDSASVFVLSFAESFTGQQISE